MNNNQSHNQEDDWLVRIAPFIIVAVILPFLVLGAVVILPAVAVSFLIGYLWFWAVHLDERGREERVLWTVLLTLIPFVYFFGLPLSSSLIWNGVFFDQLWPWVQKNISAMMGMFNSHVPLTYQIHSVSVLAMKYYGWGMLAGGLIPFILFHLKKDFTRPGGFLFSRAIVRTSIATPFLWVFRKVERVTNEKHHGDWTIILMMGIAIFLGFLNLSRLVPIPFWGFHVAYAFIAAWLVLTANVAAEPIAETSPERDSSTVLPQAAKPVQIGKEKGAILSTVRLDDEAINHHIHVVGESGFGKTVLLQKILSNRIENHHGLLFVDLKDDNELFERLLGECAKADRLSDTLIFSISHPEVSAGYNVVGRGNATEIRDRLVGALQWQEEYYKSVSSSYLLRLLRLLTHLRDKRNSYFHLGDILRCVSEKEALILLSKQIDDESLKKEALSLAEFLRDTKNHAALQGLRSQIESLIHSDFGHLLCKQDAQIDFLHAIQEKKVVIMILDSRRYGESAKVMGKLILEDLKAASAAVVSDVTVNQRELFTVVVDEFADLAMDSFISFLDRARSSKIGVVVAHQEISDLTRISPDFSKRMMGNMATTAAFLQKIPESAELIAGIAGTRQGKAYTSQIQDQGLLFGKQQTGLGSERVVEEFLIHPNQIKNLRVGECALITKYPKPKARIVQVDPPENPLRFKDDEARTHVLSLINQPRKVSVARVPLFETPQVNVEKQDGFKRGFWSDDNSDKF